MAIEDLLSRLQKVRKTGKETWVACCPAHADKRPSMTIRDKADGRVLVHCFAGCDTESILGSIGLTFHDLMPESLMDHGRPLKPAFPARDVMTCVAFEAQIVALAASYLAQGKSLPPEELQRLQTAAARVHHAKEMIDGA